MDRPHDEYFLISGIHSGYMTATSPKGLWREEMCEGVEYDRLANIKDTIELFNGIFKLDYPDLTVEYIPEAVT
jgi:hypothetical protein